MLFVPSLPDTPLTIDALLRIIAERDAEMALLKLMVDKLKLRLARHTNFPPNCKGCRTGAIASACHPPATYPE